MNLSALIPNDELLRQITERSLSVFFLYSIPTHRFEYVNPAFEQVWGREEQGVNQQLDWLLSTVHPEDLPRLQACYGLLLSTAFHQFLEFRIRLEKQEKWLYLTAHSIQYEGQRHCITGFVEDISHHKQNERTLNLFSAHKDGMLEMLAHDLNGPLGIIQSLAGQLGQQARQHGHSDMEESALLIAKTTRHSIQLIHDLLEKEYLESANTPLKLQRIDLVEQLQAMLQGMERMDQDHHKHFQLESSSPQVYVEVDQTKFLQAIQNLVSNANKFTPKEGYIRVKLQQQSDSLLLSVRDNGIGIPKDLQPHLFERFTKARRPGLKGEVTTGLGLSIVKRVVELHGGNIWVESEENEGSTFFVQIPLQRSS